MSSRRLVTLTRTNAAAAERAAEILSELDEWFEVSASADGSPADGFASIDVGGHIYDLEEASRQVVARLDEIDPTWRESLSVVDPELG
jgi:hypothetical protein